jgi:predicted transglutaminase-like cysteine proteinase
MSVFSQIVRVFFLVAVCCSAAFADKHLGTFSAVADYHTNSARDAQLVPDNKLTNLALLQFVSLASYLTLLNGEALPLPKPVVSETPDIQFVLENKLTNLALLQSASLTSHLTPLSGEALLSPKPVGSETPDIRFVPESKSTNIAPLQLASLTSQPMPFGGEALLSPGLFRDQAPDILPRPENRSVNLAPMHLGSLTPNLPDQNKTTRSYAEPFGLPAMTAQPGEIPAKWAELQSRIFADEKELSACSSGTTPCSKAAKLLLSIIGLGRKHQGLARLGWINRAVNLSIRPMSDWAQYGYADYWASPLQTLRSEAGDCEDYAIVKYVALRKLGIVPRALRLVIVQDNMHQQEHAVVAVRYQQKWLILDNRTLTMLDAEQTQHYYPLFVMDYRGVRAFSTATAHR